MNELDRYFDAYDRTQGLAAGSLDPETLRRQVRRASRRPLLELIGGILFVVSALALGLAGQPTGYFLGLGFSLAVLPRQWSQLQERTRTLGSLDDVEDLRAHLVDEASRHRIDILISALMNVGFGVLFLLTGAIAALLSKDPRPGIGAGVIFLILAVVDMRFRWKRTKREYDAIASVAGGSEESNAAGSGGGAHRDV